MFCLKKLVLSDFLLNNMIKAFCLLDVLWAASTWVMSKSVILVSKTIFWIIFDKFSFLLKGVPDISSIKDELLYWASLLTSIPLSFTTDFMLLSSWCNLVLSRWIFLLSSRSWLIFCFCFSNSFDIRCWLSSIDPTVLFILLNSTWFEHLMLLIYYLIWFISILILFSIALSFSLTQFSFSSNVLLFLSSNLSISLSIFVPSIFTVLVSMPAREFNTIYVTLYKLAIFISEKLIPCFFASACYHDEIGNEMTFYFPMNTEFTSLFVKYLIKLWHI